MTAKEFLRRARSVDRRVDEATEHTDRGESWPYEEVEQDG